VINGTQLTADSGAMQYLQVGAWFGAQDVLLGAGALSGATDLPYTTFVVSPASPAIAQGFKPSQFSQ
jgi:hypothetical protein